VTGFPFDSVLQVFASPVTVTKAPSEGEKIPQRVGLAGASELLTAVQWVALEIAFSFGRLMPE